MTKFAERMRNVDERFDCIERFGTRKRRPGSPPHNAILSRPTGARGRARGFAAGAQCVEMSPRPIGPGPTLRPGTATRMRRGEVVIRAVY